MTMPVVTCYGDGGYRTNSAAIRGSCDLFVGDGAIVADVTYGLGAFWKETEVGRFMLLRSDGAPRRPGIFAADYGRLPYADGSLDVLVFDPPYSHSSGTHHLSDRYALGKITHKNVVEFYRRGMTEGLRVLKDGGQLWVKTKDEIESGKQRRTSIAIHEIADWLGLTYFNLAIVRTNPPRRGHNWQRQRHAWKNHSCLMLFHKGPPSAAVQAYLKAMEIEQYEWAEPGDFIEGYQPHYTVLR